MIDGFVMAIFVDSIIMHQNDVVAFVNLLLAHDQV